jgi:hypothetical protein
MHRLKRHIGVHYINAWDKFLLISAVIIVGVFGMIYGLKVYAEIFKTEISVSKTNEIGLNSPVEINFSIPPLSEEYVADIKTIPETKYKLRWENFNKKLVIIPEDFWQPDTRYEMIFSKRKNAMFSEIDSQSIFFFTEKYPEVASAVPADASNNITIGAEDPITVNFKNSTKDFFIKFSLEPESELSFQNDVDKTQFKLLPKKQLEDGKKYEIKIYAKAIGDSEDNFKEIFESSFETASLTPVNREKDYKLRLEQARKYARAKIKAGKYVDINLSAQIMSIFQDGNILDAFMISSGKRGMETTKGETKIYNKFPRAYSKAYGLFMPYWMALAPSGKFGIHELPEWPSGYKEGAAHLGIPVSHGCVRLGVGAAEKVYNWAEIGTPVVIY